jgi:hypothetical protein
MTVKVLRRMPAGVERASMEETAECPDAAGGLRGYGD